MSTPQSTSSGPPGLSVPQTQPTQPTQSTPHQNIPRYSPSEEASLVAESDKLKQSANKLFTVSDFTSAITGYEKALAPLPSYLDFEIAVLRSNIAACFLKLEEWKNCIDEADKGLERLVDYEKTEGEVEEAESKEERIVEVGDDEDVQEGLVVEPKRARRRGKDEVQRIRIKLLLRRAKARTETGGWAPLQGALEGMKPFCGYDLNIKNTKSDVHRLQNTGFILITNFSGP
jgi:hypothetical protein